MKKQRTNGTKGMDGQRRKEQSRVRGRRYREKYPLLVRARRRLYYAKNHQREHAKTREWLARNRDRVNSVARAWRAKHPDKVKASKRAYYLRHRDAIRVKHREYRERNRKTLNARQRARYWGSRDPIRDRKKPGPKPKGRQPCGSPPLGYATKEQWRACLADPRLAWTICGSKVIICLEGGGKFSSVSRHLPCHGLTALQYKAKPGPDGVTPRLNKRASLMCVALQRRRSKTSRGLGLGRKLCALPNRLKFKKGVANGQKGTLQSRLNHREAMRRVHRTQKRLGWDVQRRIRQLFLELHKWIASQLPRPTTEQVTQRFMDDLRSCWPTLIPHVEAELRDRRACIAEIATESDVFRKTSKALTFANRIVQRVRAGMAPTHSVSITPKKSGRPKGKKNPDTDRRMWLAAALLALGKTEYAMSPHLYPKADKFSAEKNTDQFIRRNREEIDKRRKILGKQQAEEFVKNGMG